VAVSHATFDLDALKRLPSDASTAWFREWCLHADAVLPEAVERLAGAREEDAAHS